VVSRNVWLRTRLDVLRLIDSECNRAIEQATALCKAWSDVGVDGRRSTFIKRWSQLFARGGKAVTQAIAKAALATEQAGMAAFPGSSEAGEPGYHWPGLVSHIAPELVLQLLVEDEAAIVRVVDREAPQGTTLSAKALRACAIERMLDHRRFSRVTHEHAYDAGVSVMGEDPMAEHNESMRLGGGCSVRLQLYKDAAMRQYLITTFCLILVELVSLEDSTRSCAVCRQPGRSHCGGCGSECYCSAKCQKQHWSVHKKECKALARLGSVAPLGAERIPICQGRLLAEDASIQTSQQMSAAAKRNVDQVMKTHPEALMQMAQGLRTKMAAGASEMEAIKEVSIDASHNSAAAQPWVEQTAGMRTRSLARRQIERARGLQDIAAARGTNEAVQAEAQLLSAIELLRQLPREEQSMELLVAASLQLADTMGARAETAARAARALDDVMATPGWDTSRPEAAQVQRARDDTRARVPVEQRCCLFCGEHKPKADFTDNHWRKAKRRRCKQCQDAGILTTVASRTEEIYAHDDAEAFRRLHEEAAATEKRRVEEELARRNANEHTDAECPICFDECEATERKVLHGDMHWLCKDCLTDMLSRPQAQYTCPTCRHDLDAPRLRGLL
jgi:hypothetical protein